MHILYFTKSGGTRLEKAAILEEAPVGSGKYDIVYHNNSPELSILDVSGPWGVYCKNCN